MKECQNCQHWKRIGESPKGECYNQFWNYWQFKIWGNYSPATWMEVDKSKLRADKYHEFPRIELFPPEDFGCNNFAKKDNK